MNKTEPTVISVKNVTKKFNVFFDKTNTIKEKILFWNRSKNKQERTVLNDINLDIKKGEVVGLIGTNGSGKSTLLKLMTKDFSGRENIYFNASIFGLTRKEIDARLDQIIEFSELKDYIDNPVRTYSSGMYMRLAFSVAINVDAEILLIDEILSVGDQHFQEKCFKKIEELKKEGKTIVIVTHTMGSVERFCTRAVWLYNGKIKMDGTPNEVVPEYTRVTA